MTQAMKSALVELIALCGPWVDGGVSAPRMVTAVTAARKAIEGFELASDDLRDRARDLYQTDDIEIDDEPAISPNDHGVWVAAWVHVQNDPQDDEA